MTLRFSRLHWLLAAIFLIAGVLNTGEIVAAIRVLRSGPELARFPFSAIVATRLFGFSPHFQWQILAIDGKPFTRGYQDLDINAGKHPGDRTILTLKSPQGRTEDVPLVAESQAIRGSRKISFVATTLFLPVFCFVLGFAVAAIRIRDPPAWLLLALLLGFAEATHDSAWIWPARDAAIWLQGFLGDFWPIWMMLFGIWFPHRFRMDERLPWAKWVLIVPLAFGSVTNGLITMIWLHNVDAAIPFRPLFYAIFRTRYWLGILAVTVFFHAMLSKSFDEKDKDASRGGSCCFGPVRPPVSCPLWVSSSTLCLPVRTRTSQTCRPGSEFRRLPSCRCFR